MNEYRDTHASILRFCSDFAQEMKTWGYDLQVENLDAFGSPKEWPQKDVIGPQEFHFAIDEHTISMSVALVVSTIDDSQNFRQADILNHCLNHLLPGKVLDLYDAKSGAKRGLMVVANGSEIAPPLEAETRTMQPIMINLFSDRSV